MNPAAAVAGVDARDRGAVLEANAKVVRVAPLREQVADGLMERLRNGHFLPGERLTEGRVAHALGVSRTPVREALGILSEQGILTRRPDGGYAVAKPTLSALDELFELRRLLEPYAARRAARRVDDGDLALLRKAVGKLRKLAPTGAAAAVAETNREIRRLLFGFCGNESLARAIEQHSDQVYLMGMLTMNTKEGRLLVLRRHEGILHALSTRSESAVEKAVIRYLEDAHRSVAAALAPAGDA